jgi:cytochrome c-type biogenesis protein CcmH
MKTLFYSIILVVSQVILSAEIQNLDVQKELYPFDTSEEEIRFNKLLEDYRCPKCQSSNLSGSNAPIARDLKIEIYRLVQDGKKDSEITEFLTQRYGDFILYKPPFQPSTYLLWLGPFVLLFSTMLFALLVKRSRQKKVSNTDLRALKKQLQSELENR